jgi:hypothetical protein
MSETMEGMESPEMTPEFLYVLDLDRTLIRSDVAADALYQATEELEGIPRERLKALQDESEDSNQPFNVVSAITRLLPEGLPAEEIGNKMNKLKSRFLRLVDRNALLYEGAQTLIDQLEMEDIYIPYVIATYGGEEWQEWKLEAAGLKDKDYIITSTNLEKGMWIAHDWVQPDGTYAPPLEDEAQRQQLKAHHVVVVDDKRKSFEGLPPGNVAILVRHRDERVRSSQEEGGFQPDMVVTGIGDIVVRLNMPGRIKNENY